MNKEELDELDYMFPANEILNWSTYRELILDKDGHTVGEMEGKGLAKMVVAAVNAIPALLDYVDKLEDERREARIIARCFAHSWDHDSRPREEWLEVARKWNACGEEAKKETP